MANGKPIATGGIPGGNINALAGQGLGGGLGQGLGAAFGQGIADKRTGRNPMLDALLQFSQGQQPQTPQQALALAALQQTDPKQRGRSVRELGGAAAIAELMSAVETPNEIREVAVRGESDLNKRLGIGFEPGDSGVVQLEFDPRTGERLPGFKIKNFSPAKQANERSAGQSSALAEVLALEERRVEEGLGEFTAAEFENQLNRRRQTARTVQEYNTFKDQARNAGVPDSQIPQFDKWAPTFTAQQQFSQAGPKAAVEGLTELKADAQQGVKSLRTLQNASQLLDQGAFTGTTAGARMSLARAFDTLLGRQTNEEAVAANTEAYLANSGRLVGQVITLFGAGTGLSDADREYARIIAGGDVGMTEQALRLIIEINTRGVLGQLREYNTSRNFLGSRYPEVGFLFPEIGTPELDMPPLEKAPDNLSPAEKVEFYLGQRASFASPETKLESLNPFQLKEKPKRKRFNPETGKLEDVK